MTYKTQVENIDKYHNKNYLSPRRWSSYAIQVREAILRKPNKILEVGPGNGIVTSILRNFGLSVETMDIDERVGADYTGSITDDKTIAEISNKNKYDLIIACQIFEHVKYEDFLKSLTSIQKITKEALISLPYTELNSKFFHFSLKIPGLKNINFAKKIIYKTFKYEFNGEHYWEIGTKGYPLRRVTRDIEASGWEIKKRFLNPENPFHYFFILVKPQNEN